MREGHTERQRGERERRVGVKETKQIRVKEIEKSKTSQHININTTCDRTHALIMDIQSEFTASNSNAQHNMAVEGIDS